MAVPELSPGPRDALPAGDHRSGPHRNPAGGTTLEAPVVLELASEREAYAEVLEHEVKKAIRMLRALPAGDFERRDPDGCATALELAGEFAARVRRIEELASVRRAEPAPSAGQTRPGVIQDLETACMGGVLALDAMPPYRWHEVIAAPAGLAPWGQARRGELLWLALHDLARHQQRFALRLRSARDRGDGPRHAACAPEPRIPLAAGA